MGTPKQGLWQNCFLSSNTEENRRTRHQRKTYLEEQRAVPCFGRTMMNRTESRRKVHTPNQQSPVSKNHLGGRSSILRFLLPTAPGLPKEQSWDHDSHSPHPLQRLHPGRLSWHPSRAGSLFYPSVSLTTGLTTQGTQGMLF